jgi:hypothetical protein
MTSNNIPKIEPPKVIEFNVKQSKYEMVGKLPTRSIMVGPSGAGKGVLLSNLILDIYKNCFSRIYIMSPSIHVDYNWLAVKQYIANDMKLQETDDDKFYFDTYEPEELEKIIHIQHKITDYMKKHKYKTLYQVLIIVDDFSDEPSFSRQSKLLHSLFTRGRHNSISTIVSTQKFFAISPIIRINATQLYIFKLRNYKDSERVVEELSAIYDKQTLLKIYNTATDQAYSFLFINLMVHNKKEMFYINFNKRIEIQD